MLAGKLLQEHNAWPKLNVSVLGYALYLVINTTSLWGGVFPFFPMEFHTSETTFLFSMTQSLSFLGTFIATLLLSYKRPEWVRRPLLFAGAAPIFFGAFSLIAALYLPTFKLGFIVASGVLLGVGGAGFAFAWQRYFASEQEESGNFYLLVATATAPFLFFILYFVPPAVTVYFVPLIMVPLSALCALLVTRTIDFSMPQFSDIPEEHPQVYRRILKDYGKSALAIGAVGFASGTVRAIAVLDVRMGDATNIASMIGLLAAAALMLWWWRSHSFRIDSQSAFLVVFPFALAVLMVFPFLEQSQVFLMAGAVYLLFTIVQIIMILQCAQISRNRGVNPVYVYAFFGSVVYGLQSVGFLFGYASKVSLSIGFTDAFTIALVCMTVLAGALYVIRGKYQLKLSDLGFSDPVEFYSMRHKKRGVKGILDNPIQAAVREQGRTNEAISSYPTDEQSVNQYESEDNKQVKLPDVHSDSAGIYNGSFSSLFGSNIEYSQSEMLHITDAVIRDLPENHSPRDYITRGCAILQEEFRLTNRETEVMEMIVRGNTVARIADVLVISENTVRTHSKHIYTKLDVHRRQDIIDMIDGLRVLED